MKWAILLTSCVRKNNSSDLKKMYYLKSIRDWLEKTDYPIFIVESSGYTFPEFNKTRLKVCSINLENLSSSSQFEARSILHAFDYFKNDLLNYTHILKVTARYFVDIKSVLSNMENVDFMVQHHYNDTILWNNSEIFGFRKGLEHFVDHVSDPGGILMENALYHFSRKFNYKFLPPLKNIHRARRGGDKLLYEYL
jgi:hypothetical protein